MKMWKVYDDHERTEIRIAHTTLSVTYSIIWAKKKRRRPNCPSTYFNKSLFETISKTHAIKTVFGHNHILEILFDDLRGDN